MEMKHFNELDTDYDVELDVEHEPYMYGDANADTFRPDYIITRAEGALVLARIFGLDYEKETTITTKYTDIKDFYLNDMHENNFIIDNNTDSIRVVDIDSCKINGNYTFGSKYLSPTSFISATRKYQQEDNVNDH